MSVLAAKQDSSVNRLRPVGKAGDSQTLRSPCHPVTLSPGHPPQPAVSCRGLTKDFGSGEAAVKVLRGIDLDVQAGAMTLLVGPSGCGKTTLISVLAATLDPTAGEVTVLGSHLTRMRDRDKVTFRGKYIGFVFQQFNLLPALT